MAPQPLTTRIIARACLPTGGLLAVLVLTVAAEVLAMPSFGSLERRRYPGIVSAMEQAPDLCEQVFTMSGHDLSGSPRCSVIPRFHG